MRIKHDNKVAERVKCDNKTRDEVGIKHDNEGAERVKCGNKTRDEVGIGYKIEQNLV